MDTYNFQNLAVNRIFSPWNVDDNCLLISKLLQLVKLQIYKYLQDRKCEEAVIIYIQLLNTLSQQFVNDRHYLYIDSRYYPDIDCNDIYYWMQNTQAEGKFNASIWQKLDNTLRRLKQSDTYREYCIPTVCKNYKERSY